MDTSKLLLTKNGLPYDYNKESNTYITFLIIHYDHIGYIIGENGRNIKNLTNKKNIKISLENTNKFTNNNKWFKIESKNDLYSLISTFNKIVNIAIKANIKTFTKFFFKKYLKKNKKKFD